jgi:hypothetical protein
LVYNTLCKEGGWWGHGCPSERELVSWLLFKEGSTLSEKDKVNMARGIRYRFHTFSSNRTTYVEQLAFFTPFISPDGDSSLALHDWSDLLYPTADLTDYRRIVDYVYNRDIGLGDGNYLYWWSDYEIKSPRKSWPGESGITYFIARTPTGNFYFTGIPNIASCAMRGVSCK